MGSANHDTAKHVGALFGHAATVGSHAVAAMPMAAPEHLTMPGGSLASGPMVSASPAAVHSYRPAQMTQQQQPQQQIMYPQNHSMSMMQHPQHAMAQAMFHQQQQQQMMQQHQQQMMQQQMMQQQIANQQLQIQQQQQQMAMMKQQAVKTAAPISQNETTTLENWHEGLEEEIKNMQIPEMEESEILGHAGLTNGASIEELAAAWAQAEAEYEGFDQHEEDPEYANLFQGSALTDSAPQAYEFTNKVGNDEDMPKDPINWMDEGIRHFQQGNLKEAIRSFEMELQQNNPDNATAWRMLGRCHAENDMDPEAIKCLEAAVDRDPYSPESLLALGVSYVNELNYVKALENMKAWFTHNPKYAGMELPIDASEEFVSGARPNETRAFEEVKKMLHAALQFDASDAADVHEALGVIYNVKKDYDAAAEEFRKALESRPDDHQLWNKLGATLANGSQSDKALPAYHQALKLKPKYARAWLNMAISHSNLQDHDEAARCYLQCLSLNPSATHCWTYLRMALSCAERWDILPLVFAQDLPAFLEHFDFVLEQ